MYKIAKRLFDILLALLALVILSPVWLLCIVILLLTGEHEVFFFQKRMGYKNRLFSIWKFATMLKNSPNIGTGEITLRNDPRVTAFGKFLRISKLNELPQVINVIKGDMSIVGPRPLMKISVQQYPPEIREIIYDCKPGMTGIGSLIFRDEEKLISDSPDPQTMYGRIYAFKGELELWYQRNASFFTDLSIVFLTGWTILFPNNKLTGRFFKNLPRRPF
jgi:lipopolysaccharide/colanic/teichoic acid biosynthesis glycosyltransferase